MIEEGSPNLIRNAVSVYQPNMWAAQSGVRPFFVVVAAPGSDHRPCMIDRREVLLVQALVFEFAVEGFDEGVLRRLSGLDYQQFDSVGFDSQVQGHAESRDVAS